MDSEKRDRLVNIVSQLVDLLSDEVQSQVVLPKQVEEKGIPISIFRSNLAGLEAIVLFLKNTRKMSTKEIATVLNRDVSTIYTTYQNAIKKLKGGFDTSDFSTALPVDIFSDRKFSILESLIAHLKGTGQSLVEISKRLNKNYSTIKTVYRRHKDKCQ